MRPMERPLTYATVSPCAGCTAKMSAAAHAPRASSRRRAREYTSSTVIRCSSRFVARNPAGTSPNTCVSTKYEIRVKGRSPCSSRAPRAATSVVAGSRTTLAKSSNWNSPQGTPPQTIRVSASAKSGAKRPRERSGTSVAVDGCDDCVVRQLFDVGRLKGRRRERDDRGGLEHVVPEDGHDLPLPEKNKADVPRALHLFEWLRVVVRGKLRLRGGLHECLHRFLVLVLNRLHHLLLEGHGVHLLGLRRRLHLGSRLDFLPAFRQRGDDLLRRIGRREPEPRRSAGERPVARAGVGPRALWIGFGIPSSGEKRQAHPRVVAHSILGDARHQMLHRGQLIPLRD